jgi:hypothetical protein
LLTFLSLYLYMFIFLLFNLSYIIPLLLSSCLLLGACGLTRDTTWSFTTSGCITRSIITWSNNTSWIKFAQSLVQFFMYRNYLTPDPTAHGRRRVGLKPIFRPAYVGCWIRAQVWPSCDLKPSY